MRATIHRKTAACMLAAFGAVALLSATADARTREGRCHFAKTEIGYLLYKRCLKCESKGLPDFAGGTFDLAGCIEQVKNVCVDAFARINAAFDQPAPEGCATRDDGSRSCQLIVDQCSDVSAEIKP